MKYYETAAQYFDLSGLKLSGRVLDIGGGGEGIISRCVGGSVTAIDNRAEELAETADIGIKIIMDACDLKFLDGYFDHVTCFFSLMYMGLPQIEKFLGEAFRVLKKDGELRIWDAVIPPKQDADVFVAQVAVKTPGREMVKTGYGVSFNREQSVERIENLCVAARFIVQKCDKYSESFSLHLRKESLL
ncbi:MAG: class I SAM-dependent methyltransferase [Clostridiales bacterium]|jgi:ubiquinone/menaquinone biosynthesis C-methylase UbiE|nr:class I SAM-dependent methyltransferase [Clostridiales bacterium]